MDGFGVREKMASERAAEELCYSHVSLSCGIPW
jgi:hypothetical protein